MKKITKKPKSERAAAHHPVREGGAGLAKPTQPAHGVPRPAVAHELFGLSPLQPASDQGRRMSVVPPRKPRSLVNRPSREDEFLQKLDHLLEKKIEAVMTIWESVQAQISGEVVPCHSAPLMAPLDDELLTVHQVAALTKLGVSTVYRWAAEGTRDFPRQRKIGPRASRWSRKQVEKWIHDHGPASDDPNLDPAA